MAQRKIKFANPYDLDWAPRKWVLWFGACAPTHVLVCAASLDSAVKDAAEYLAEHAPGLVTSVTEMDDLRREACDDAGLTWPPPNDWCDRPAYVKALESAEADLTYTESGWLTSYEWGIELEDPSKADLVAFAQNR